MQEFYYAVNLKLIISLFQLSQLKSFPQESKNERDGDFWWKCVEDKKIFGVWFDPHHIRSPAGGSEKEFVQMKSYFLKFAEIGDLNKALIYTFYHEYMDR